MLVVLHLRELVFDEADVAVGVHAAVGRQQVVRHVRRVGEQPG